MATNNPKGRPKGTPNVITQDMRRELKAIVESELHHLPDILETLTPLRRIDVLMKLIPYVLPKIEPVRSDDGEPFGIDVF